MNTTTNTKSSKIRANKVKKMRMQARILKFLSFIMCCTTIYTMTMIAHNERLHQVEIEVRDQQIDFLNHENKNIRFKYDMITKAQYVEDDEHITSGNYDCYSINDIEYLYNTATGDVYYATEAAKSQIR